MSDDVLTLYEARLPRVEAVQVTRENIHEVAEFIGGTWMPANGIDYYATPWIRLPERLPVHGSGLSTGMLGLLDWLVFNPELDSFEVWRSTDFKKHFQITY